MKSILKAIGIGIFAGILANSCTSDAYQASELDVSKETVKVIANPYAISGEDALSAANTIMNKTIVKEHPESSLSEITLGGNTLSTRSGSSRQAYTSSKNYSVRIEAASTSVREVRQEIPVYTINYKDAVGEDAGFVVMAGDSRIQGNILIMSNEEEGGFDMELRADADFLEDRITGYLYNCINFETYKNPTTPSSRLWWFVLLDNGVILSQIEDPYTRYHPFRGFARAAVGPAAVAMSEIMAWNQWPEQSTFLRYTNTISPVVFTADYTLNTSEWAVVQSKSASAIASASDKVKDYIGNLLVETGYRLNSSFGVYGTTAVSSDAKEVFIEMGYLNTMVLGDYSYATVKYDIFTALIPVYMYGTGSWWNSPYKEYPYVIYGIMEDSYSGVTDRYMYLVDGTLTFTGHGFSLGAWFNEKIFSIYSQNVVGTNLIPGVSQYFPYKYECKTITNIKPNPSKNGSTNAYWTVNRGNPY